MRIKLLIGFIISTILVIMNIGFLKVFPDEFHLFSWPVTLNVFTFFLYWFDKRQSIKNGIRIPNMIMYILAITGGIIGTLMGMYCFRHKTKKIIYILNMWVILILYGVAVYAYFHISDIQQYLVQLLDHMKQYIYSFFGGGTV
jgi:uncharacterized membrane protein YsdA (DUF1294 family)